MKKLLIAMTAAAVGTCAWAEGEAGGGEGTEPTTTTYFTETFADWSNDAEAGYVTSVAAPWSYGTVAVDGEGNPTLNTADPQADELKVVNGALSLNTGSKVLRGAFGESTVAIPNDGLYFKSTVTFKDPSDTLPTLGAQDKFALVVLDNVESFEANPKLATTQTTNLFVIAQYGATSGTKRAYKLTIPTELDEDGNIAKSITDLTADWLSTPKMIEVKAYNNVMADSEEARAGFLVSVDGFVCKVYASYPIVGDLIDFTDNGGVKFGMASTDEYLGVAPTAITGSLQARYTDDQLILSLTDNASDLSSVDFQGQGDIDDVSLTASATTDFGPDSLVLNVAKTDGITFEPGTSALMYYAKGDSVTIKFKVNEGFELELPADLSADDNGVYTYVYTPTANDQTVTISAFEPVAIVEGTKYKTVQAALEAIAENGGTGTVVLNGNVTLTDDDVDSNGLTITSGEITIDLNGNTIVAEECNTIGVTDGKLIVEDSKGGGAILAAEGFFAIDASAGLTEIKAGTIGLINNYDNAETLKLVGGSYTDVGDTFYLTTEQMKYGDKQYEATRADDGVWTVAEKVVVKYNVTVSATGATVTGVTAGEYADKTELSFTVAADEANGYENAVVTVNGNTVEPVENVYTVTVNGGNVAIVVTASLKTFNVALNLTNATVSGVEAKAYDYGTEISFTAAVAGADYENLSVTIEGAECTQDGDTYTFTVTGAVTITVTADKKAPAGPTVPENQGSVSEPDANGNVTVTPATGVTEITISGTVTGTVSVPSSIEKVSGVEFSKLVITYTDKNTGVTSVITDAFKSGANGEIVLDETAVVNDVPVKPVMAEQTALPDGMTAPFEAGTDVAVGVKTIPGLKYQLIRSDAPNGTFGDVPGASATGTGAPVKLSDGQKPTGKAFYKIKVMPR